MPDAPRDPPPDPAPGDGPPRDGPHDGARDGPHDGATLIVPGGIDASDSAPPAAIACGEEDGGGPLVFGRYRLIRPLGRGGMGAVYLARDVQLDRDVALKTPSKRAAANPELAERFLREARAAALLRHPHLCPVFDAGEEDGRLYLTMAYLPGRSLREATGGPQPIRATARLLGRLADAMAHAHDQGVVHRDLKPGNVMLDERGKPAITDFGLALRTGGEATDGRVTQSGAALGTPAYMAPEQIVGRQDLIGPRSDIYSLGVILYELLTGRLPFGGDAMAMMGQALTQTARPPGEVRAEAGDGFAPVPAALESIWRRMTALDPAERFDSMHEVRDALADFVKTGRGRPDDEPEPDPDSDSGTDAAAESGELRIAEPAPDFSALRELDSTHPGPIVLPVRRLGRRSAKQKQAARWKRGLAAVAALAALGAVALLFGDPADSLQTLTGDVLGDVTGVQIGPGGGGGAIPPGPDPAAYGSGAAEGGAGAAGDAAGRWTDLLADPNTGRPSLAAWEQWNGGPVPPAWELLPDGVLHRREDPDGGGWKHKGPDLATRDDYGDFELTFDWKIGGGGNSGIIYRAAPGPDFSFRAGFEYQLQDDHARFRANNPPETWSGAVYGFTPVEHAANPAGEWNEGRIRVRGKRIEHWLNGTKLVDAEAGSAEWEDRARARDRPPSRADLAAPTGRFVVQDLGWEAWVRNLLVRPLAPGEGRADGAGARGASTGIEIQTPAAPPAAPMRLVADVPPPRVLTGHEAGVRGVAVTPDGRSAVSASFDRSVRVWDLDTGAQRAMLAGHDDAVVDVAVTSDGRRAVTASVDATLRVWDLDDGREEHTLRGYDYSVYALALAPDGRRAVSLSNGGSLRVWDLDTGAEERRVAAGVNGGNTRLAVTPDGRYAVGSAWDGTLRVWDLGAGRLEFALATDAGHLYDVAVTPDGAHAVTGSSDGTVRLWDLRDGQPGRVLRGHTGSVWGVAVAPDGRHVVSGSLDRTVRVWDVASGRCERTLTGHADTVKRLCVTPDGRRLVSASMDRTLRVWDLFEPDPDPPESNPGAPDPDAPDPDAPDPRAAAAGPGPAADGRVDLFNARDLTDRAPRRVPRRRVACGGRGGKVAG